MPATDYTDPEIPFPRLQARIQKAENDAYWITIWLWEKPGNERPSGILSLDPAVQGQCQQRADGAGQQVGSG
jgi:hypothetical protein